MRDAMPDPNFNDLARAAGEHGQGILAMAAAAKSRVLESKLVQIVAGAAVVSLFTTLANWYIAIPGMQARLDTLSAELRATTEQTRLANETFREARHEMDLKLAELKFRVQALEGRR